jgi:hypothetical protein
MYFCEFLDVVSSIFCLFPAQMLCRNNINIKLEIQNQQSSGWKFCFTQVGYSEQIGLICNALWHCGYLHGYFPNTHESNLFFSTISTGECFPRVHRVCSSRPRRCFWRYTVIYNIISKSRYIYIYTHYMCIYITVYIYNCIYIYNWGY